MKEHIFYIREQPFTNKGGITVVFYETKTERSTTIVSYGVAYCSPNDLFNKKIGVSLAKHSFTGNDEEINFKLSGEIEIGVQDPYLSTIRYSIVSDILRSDKTKKKWVKQLLTWYYYEYH